MNRIIPEFIAEVRVACLFGSELAIGNQTIIKQRSKILSLSCQ
jgi:hypothetical protein